MAEPRARKSSGALPPAGAAVPTTPATGWLTPERVAHAEFRTSFRGLDTTEVRSFLARVASELRTMMEAQDELRAELETFEERHRAPEVSLDVHKVTELVGQETARVLETAREAAADMRANAEASAAATIEAAEAEAERLRAEAEALLAERTAEAEANAEALRAEAEAAATEARSVATDVLASARAEAATILDSARDEAAAMVQAARDDADAERDAGREDGRRMVAEARAVRERILADMARRRNVARQQIERVRAARERLIEAIEAVKVSVSDAQAELGGSLVEAKLAGDRAARQVDVDAIPSQRELETEVELAKDTGLIDLRADVVADADDADDADDELGDDLSPIDTGEFAALTADAPRAGGGVAAGRGPDADLETADGQGETDDTEADEAGGTVIDLTAVEDAPPGPPEAPTPGRRRGKPQKSAGELFARLRSSDATAPRHLTDAGGVNGANGAHANGLVTVAEGGADVEARDDADATDVEDADDAGAAGGAAAPTVDRVELHKRDALLAGTMRDLSRQLKLALSDQQNGLLEAARARRGPKPPAGPVLPEAAELAAPYREVARRELAAAAQLGWRAVAPDDTAPGEVDVDELAGSLAEALARDLNANLQRDDGTSDDDQHLAERVRAAYRELRSQRLGDLASHHVLTAFGLGQLAAAPAGARARWVYDTCGPDCLDNALAGPLAFGEAFPTGHTHPPAFEGCRCLLVAVEAREVDGVDGSSDAGEADEADEADASDAG